MSDDQELESFTTQIDPRTYAADQGYALDRRESWRGSSVMRHTRDKLVVKRDHDGHYVYFSVRDDRDNGSIIDFLQKRRPARLELWIGRISSAPSLFPSLEKLRVTGSKSKSSFGGCRVLRVIRTWKLSEASPLPCSAYRVLLAGCGSTVWATRSSRISIKPGFAAMRSRAGTSPASHAAAKRVYGFQGRMPEITGSFWPRAR